VTTTTLNSSSGTSVVIDPTLETRGNHSQTIQDQTEVTILSEGVNSYPLINNTNTTTVISIHDRPSQTSQM
jgi:hypothetical protein